MKSKFIWVFVGESAKFPSGIYCDYDTACAWIKENKLNGVLTKYPVNIGVYDWAISNGFFVPKKEEHYSSFFIGKFTSASMEHFHFENGSLV